MSNRCKWRGMNVDLNKTTPVDFPQTNPEIVKSARSAINGIIQAGFKGVAVVNAYNKKTGQTEKTLLIDASTIEGITAAEILGSLSTATEPFDHDFVLNKLVFDYMCWGLPFPNPAVKRKGQQR